MSQITHYRLQVATVGAGVFTSGQKFSRVEALRRIKRLVKKAETRPHIAVLRLWAETPERGRCTLSWCGGLGWQPN